MSLVSCLTKEAILKYIVFTLTTLFMSFSSASAQNASSPAAAPTASEAEAAASAEEEWPEAWFEIFKLAPGKQEEFVRLINQTDQINAAAGLPPTQMFFHENGGDFDVILFKPSTGKLTAQQEAMIAAKRKEVAKPSGPAYFVYIRELIAAHTDSKTIGPISANMWLQRLEEGRARNQTTAESDK